MYSPAKAGAIINSCIVLHNILEEKKYPVEDLYEETEENEENPIADNLGNNRARGSGIRNRLIQTYF